MKESISVIGRVLLVLALAWQSCGPEGSEENSLTTFADTVSPPVVEFDTTIQASKTAQVDTFRNIAFATYRLRAEQEDIRIWNSKGDSGVHTFISLDQIADTSGKEMAFAMNAGMFTQERGSLGLLVTEGEEKAPLIKKSQGYGNFYIQPNGVFALDTAGKAYVVTTPEYDSLAKATSIAYATQSGPMMLIADTINGKFTDGSQNLHIRNAVGITHDSTTIFAISLQKTSFFDFSLFLQTMGCHHALYLDGFISKMYLPALNIGTLEAGSSLGPIITVFE
ncbi:MAG: phosphodiester glycosidase family protein [Bacteroidota bacterium]